MERIDLDNFDLPDAPGVYLFKRGEEVLYVGKATSLRDRVRSYFAGDIDKTRGSRIVKMLLEAETIEWLETDSVLEALLLEANRIKFHAPTYNAIGKDNKTYNYVVLTNEDFPQLILVRGRELQTVWDPDDIKYSFGPFVSGGQLKEALKIIRKIFPYRDPKCAQQTDGKPCFNRQLGRCPGVCEGIITKQEYSRTIRNLRYFFEGKKGELLKALEQDMQDAAEQLDFESAEVIKRQIFALKHINDTALLSRSAVVDDSNAVRIEAYDIAHSSNTDTVGVMTVVVGGAAAKGQYRKFIIKNPDNKGDVAALRELLERRLGHPEWPLPKLIVVDGAKAQLNVAQAVLEENGYEIPIVGVVKNEHHQPRRLLGSAQHITEYEHDILLANNEAHRFALAFHRQKRSKRSLGR